MDALLDTFENFTLSSSEDDISLLESLVLHQSDEYILKLLQDSKKKVNVSMANGRTPLHIAVCRPSLVIAERLIELGADLNAQDQYEWTPLHYAIDACNLEAVYMLLYFNVDVSICCDHFSPLFRAIYYKRLDIVEALLYHYFDEPACAEALLILAKMRCAFAFNLRFENYVIWPNDYKWGEICCYLFVSTTNTAETFKKLCSLVDFSDLTYAVGFLNRFTAECQYPSDQFIDCLFTLLELPVIGDLVTNVESSPGFFYPHFSYISELLQHFIVNNTEPNKRLAVLYTCFSLGFKILPRDFDTVYYIFGYGPELEAVIYTDTYDSNNADFDYVLCPVQASILFNDTSESLQDLFANLVTSSSEESEVLDAFKYFTLPAHFKSRLISLCPGFYHQVLQKLNEVALVPTLLELSRDQVRRNLINSHRYCKAYQYLDAVKRLQLPKVVQNIVTFKSPLYTNGAY